VIQLEICANSVTSALAAQAGGAARVELCANLKQGGITPSYGEVMQARKLLHIPLHVLIRPREGDFNYNDVEFETMKADIELCKQVGCNGVVLGILTTEGQIDIDRTAALVKLAQPMEVTFHRAFDQTADLPKALEDIIKTGCKTILTSGGKPTASDGLSILQKLLKQADNRIEIMPGCGINEHNIKDLAKLDGIKTLHTSAKTNIKSDVQLFSKEVVFQSPDFQLTATDQCLVKQLVYLANS
jgi:copper homeostasis protein